jgi:hypothetical protein
MSDRSGQHIDIDHFLLMAKVKEKLAVSKQTTHRVHMERFNFKKLKKLEGKDQYHVETSNRFAALKNLDTKVDINKAWETIQENSKISSEESLGYYELKKHKPWFDERCSELLGKMKQAKLQRSQDASGMNGYNLDNKRSKTSRNFRKK